MNIVDLANNADIINEICQYLPPEMYLICNLVCKAFYQMDKSNIMIYIPCGIAGCDCHYPDLVIYGSELGSYSMIEYGFANGYTFSHRSSAVAAQNDDTNMLKWIYERDSKFSKYDDLCIYATMTGSFNTLKWLSQCGFNIQYQCALYAIKFGYSDIFQWLLNPNQLLRQEYLEYQGNKSLREHLTKNGIEYDFEDLKEIEDPVTKEELVTLGYPSKNTCYLSDDLFRKIGKYGRLEILDFIESIGCEQFTNCSEFTYSIKSNDIFSYSALHYGQIEFLEAIISRGYNIIYDVIEHASYDTTCRSYQWLYDRGVLNKNDAYKYAFEIGNIELLNWVQNIYGNSIITIRLDDLIKFVDNDEYLDVLKWCYKYVIDYNYQIIDYNGIGFPFDELIKKVTDITILEWFYNQGTKLTQELIMSAIQYNDTYIVEWLVQHNCPKPIINNDIYNNISKKMKEILTLS